MLEGHRTPARLHSLNKYILSIYCIYYVSGTVVGTRDIVVNKMDEIPVL